MKFLWKIRTRSHHIWGCGTHCQIEPALSNTHRDAGKGNLQPLYSGLWWQCWETCFLFLQHHCMVLVSLSISDSTVIWEKFNPVLQYTPFFCIESGFFSQSLVVWQLKGLCHAMKRALAFAEQSTTLGSTRGSLSALREGQHDELLCTTLLLATITSRTKNTTSTRWLLDISCA